MQPTQSQTPVTGESPKRIQRRRVKGWKMPEGAVYVGRPTKWGNPFRVIRTKSGLWTVVDDNGVDYRESLNGWRNRSIAVRKAVALFFMYLDIEPHAYPPLSELRGKDLVCWCPLSSDCHADVLLSLANPAGGE